MASWWENIFRFQSPSDEERRRLLESTSRSLSGGYGAGQRSAPPKPPPRVPTTSTSSQRNQTGMNLRPRGNPPREQQNPLGDLYQQLLEMLQSSPGIDQGALRGQVDPIYDARRAAIESLMAQAQERVSEGRGEIEQMYEALGQDYERLAPEAKAQADAARQEIEELYGQLRTNIEGHYSQVSQDQSELFKQLGIEDAAPEVSEPQARHQAAAMSRADELGAINQQRYIDMGNIDQSYYRQGAPLARLQGSNMSSQLMRDLEDFLAQQSSEIGMVEAERTAALNQLMAQAQQQAQTSQRERMQMLWQMMQSQAEGQEPVELNADNFYSSLPPDRRRALSEAFRQLERSRPVLRNQVPGEVAGTYVAMHDNYWPELVEDMYRNNAIDEQTYNDLMLFVRLQFELPKIGL